MWVNQKLMSFDYCDEIVNSVLNEFSSLKNICFLLCGLFALAYFANILMKTWAKGESFDFHSLFKPFIIGLVILNFNLVYSLIDDIVRPITVYVENISKSQDDKIKKAEESYKLCKEKYENEIELKKAEGDIGLFDKVNNFIDNIENTLSSFTMEAIEIILSIILAALKVTIRLYNITLRLILILFGPISFAISVIPYFKDNWKSWMAKYINVSLYLPVAAAIDVIISKFRIYYLTDAGNQYKEAVRLMEANNGIFGADAHFEVTCFVSLFMLAFVCMYMIIPIIVGFIIEKGDTSGVTKALAGAVVGTTELTRRAGKYVKNKVGNAKDSISTRTNDQKSSNNQQENSNSNNTNNNNNNNNNGSAIIN